MDLTSIHIQRKLNPHLHGPEWVLADEITKHFGERKQFAMYLGTIRRIGMPRARAIFANVKESNSRNPRAFFFYLVKNDTT